MMTVKTMITTCLLGMFTTAGAQQVYKVDINGCRLTSVPQQGAVCLMKAIDKQGRRHTMKVIKK